MFICSDPRAEKITPNMKAFVVSFHGCLSIISDVVHFLLPAQSITLLSLI